MLVFTVSDVVHEPIVSAIRGQFPVTVDVATNDTWFPGGTRLWSALALAGVTSATIVHVDELLLWVTAPHPVNASKTTTSAVIANRAQTRRLRFIAQSMLRTGYLTVMLLRRGRLRDDVPISN